MIPPQALGFFMPAEWQPHAAAWLAWPYDVTTFPGRVAQVERIYVQIIKTLYRHETVKLVVRDQAMLEGTSRLLTENGIEASKIQFYTADYADVWTRDYGPTFLIQPQTRQLAWVKWQYNAYGKASDPYFAPLLMDNEVFNKIHPAGEKFDSGIVMEGGAIDVNGAGVALTTEQCLLNPNRNPDLTKDQTEQCLQNYLGAEKIIWLKKGLAHDHTDGHIDEIARFASDDTILYAWTDDKTDENYGAMKENLAILRNATGAKGNKFSLVALPLPKMNFDDGQPAPVSYLNFYIGNQVVLASTFQDANDGKALDIIARAFPGRKIVPIDCTDLIYGGGAAHCIVQQEPVI